jgi:hypothetical protein
MVERLFVLFELFLGLHSHTGHGILARLTNHRASVTSSALQIYCGSVTPPVLVTVGATGHAGTDSREAESENISPRLH